MANETTVQTSCIQVNSEDDECRENIPPRAVAEAGTSKLKAQVGDVVGKSSLQTGSEKVSLSDTSDSSTPTQTNSNDRVEAKSRIFGLQSALTPIIKILNIGNTSPTPEALKHGNKSHPTVATSYTDFSSSHSGRLFGDMNAPVRLLEDETLPDITLFDVTCDSTMHRTQNDSVFLDSVPATPVTASASSMHSTLQPSHLTAKENNSEFHLHELSKLNWTTASMDPSAQMIDPPDSMYNPQRWLPYFPEITLLDVTRDSESSPRGELSYMTVMQDLSPEKSLKNDVPHSELSEPIEPEPGTRDVIQGESLSSTLDGNGTHVSSFSEPSNVCAGENATKASLEATRDISIGSVSENSGRSSQEPDEPVVTSNTEEILNVTLPSPKTAVSVNGTFNVNQNSNLSTSGTFNVNQNSNLSTPGLLNYTAQISCPQNNTLDLLPSNVGTPKVEGENEDLTNSVSNITTETSPVTNQSSLALKAGGSCDVQNATFDQLSLQESSGNANLKEADALTGPLQNDTFDTKLPPAQNGTITLSESSSNDIHQNTIDKPSPPKVCNVTSSPTEGNYQVQPHELSKKNGSTVSIEPSESTFEANPAVEMPYRADGHENKDPSQSGLPLTDGLSENMGHQSMDTGNNNKANTFNLDDTLDLGGDPSLTSTPMPTSKIISFKDGWVEGTNAGAQKKLYGDGPSTTDGGQMASGIPNNIVCDRKTFLTQPAAKARLLPPKATTLLLKYKPVSARPGRFEPLKSTPATMTRQRTQADALRDTAASDATNVTTETSGRYNLRATKESKLPCSGLRKLQKIGMPSGIQRAASGLRPPLARSITPAASITDKLSGPTVFTDDGQVADAANPLTKISQGKKHPLGRGESLSVAAKRKKMDATLPTVNADATTSDATNGARILKRPTSSLRALPAKAQSVGAAVPTSTAQSADVAVSRVRALKQPANSNRGLPAKRQCHDCANCLILNQQLKMRSEEIMRLKEELLKYRQKEEGC